MVEACCEVEVVVVACVLCCCVPMLVGGVKVGTGKDEVVCNLGLAIGGCIH